MAGAQVPGSLGLYALEALPVAFSAQGWQRCVLRSPPSAALFLMVGALAQCRDRHAICNGVPRCGSRGASSIACGGRLGGGATRVLTDLEVWAPNMYPSEAEPVPPAAFHPLAWPEDLLDPPPPTAPKAAGGGGVRMAESHQIFLGNPCPCRGPPAPPPPPESGNKSKTRRARVRD